MYNAIQTELVRIYTEKDDQQRDFLEQPQDFRRRLTNLNEEEGDDDVYKNYDDEAVTSTATTKKPGDVLYVEQRSGQLVLHTGQPGYFLNILEIWLLMD